MLTARGTFTTADYMVLVLVLVLSALIGAFFAYKGRKSTCNKEFLVGNRKLQVFPVTMSMMATFLSAIAFLGIPAENFVFGFQYILVAGGAIIGVFIASEFFMPIFYDMDSVSVNAYLEQRFKSRLLRKIASILFIIQQCIYLGVVLYGPSLTLGSVTGLPVWISVIINGIVCTLYTSLGGIKAVVWTDVLQMSLMVVGFMMVFLPGVLKSGGLRNLFDEAGHYGLLDFDFRLDFQKTFTVWGVLLGWTVIWAINYSCSQSMVQRYCSVRSVARSRASLYVNLVGVSAVLAIACICGLVLFSEYRTCDPIKAGQLNKYDELMPHFVLRRFAAYPGLAGLFVSAAYSGSLSTMSSGYNSLAALIWEDFLVSCLGKRLSSKAIIRLTKGIATFFGLFTMLIAFMASHLRSIVQASIATGGSFTGGVGGLFFLGVLFPWCGNRAALTSLLVGVGIGLWVSVGSLLIPRPPVYSQFTSVKDCFSNYNITISVPITTVPKPPPSIYTISYMWIPVISFVVTFFLGVLFTAVQGLKHSAAVDPRLVSPALRGFYKNWLKRLKAERSLNSKVDTMISSIYRVHLISGPSANSTLSATSTHQRCSTVQSLPSNQRLAIGMPTHVSPAGPPIGVTPNSALLQSTGEMRAAHSLYNLNTLSSINTLESTTTATLTRSLASSSSNSDNNNHSHPTIGNNGSNNNSHGSNGHRRTSGSGLSHNATGNGPVAENAAATSSRSALNGGGGAGAAGGSTVGGGFLVPGDDAITARADPTVITYV
ncbi:sodium-coupled monocarboxylate transporter 2-like isoform X2 [Varroa jacobsoni]|uniref:sodium-coupled monocarboxylate transporter 2-like isoform X2 n=1 Tax=Varroa jacobsoni TaxID=62625 RepID=UPI000BF85E5F|nr:sodium-coupled monocarboxylate transporter 2-like isoform X2 [Varroa jacobsoni]